MLTIILADTELETMPERMVDDYAIRKIAKKSGKRSGEMLLDSNYMHTAIERSFPGESTRRGRPDIVHTFLLTSLESILNRSGNLKILVHTRNDRVISFSPSVRIPRAYNRFTGLVEDLFRKGKIVSGNETLMSVEDKSLRNLVDSFGEARKILLWPKADQRPMHTVIDSGKDLLCVIGGFAGGDFITDTGFIEEKISIYPEELTVWTVSGEIIAQYERALKLV